MVYIVYGGAGYIGSHLIAQLLHSGKRVICIDNLVNSFSSIFQDMSNLENLTLVTSGEYKYEDMEKVEAIFHFAALKSVPESFIKPSEYYENNIGITCRALDMCEDTGCDTFIFSGSASVYGSSSPSSGSSESDPLNPLSPYGRTKVVCENLIKDFAALHSQKRFFSLRYFNPYGGTEIPKKKDCMNLIPALQNAVKTNTPFKIFGTVYSTIDGTCVRDFIHINDLIRGHMVCLTYTPLGFHVFNLGSGKGSSVLQIVNMFKTKYPRLIVEMHPRREGDAPFIYANIDKARVELNWTPRISMTVNTL
jgi:UDP-glucose 4-epimerase